MGKVTSKRAYHKKDMIQLHRKALTIGGVLAAISLLTIICSFVK